MEKLATELVGAIRMYQKFRDAAEKALDCNFRGSRESAFGSMAQHLWSALDEINPDFDKSDEAFEFIYATIDSKLSDKKAAQKLLDYKK